MLRVLDTSDIFTVYGTAFGACLVTYMIVLIIFNAVRGR